MPIGAILIGIADALRPLRRSCFSYPASARRASVTVLNYRSTAEPAPRLGRRAGEESVACPRWGRRRPEGKSLRFHDRGQTPWVCSQRPRRPASITLAMRRVARGRDGRGRGRRRGFQSCARSAGSSTALRRRSPRPSDRPSELRGDLLRRGSRPPGRADRAAADPGAPRGSRRLLVGAKAAGPTPISRTSCRVSPGRRAWAWLADTAAADVPQASIGNNGGVFNLHALLANLLNCFDTIEHL